ncbi:hypothetical protein F5Y10DRAFT_246838 [Nemania abortiva]|nr:hypothetical protein F5Y10DRAFT_246838 [Nemania abortiva]
MLTCSLDFRPDHMRMQLDTGKMSDADFDIYEIFGEPKVWYVNDSQSENDDGRPRYLVEPADLAGLEARYRTGRIAIDSFSASYREGDVSEPQMLDTHYAAPEIHFLKKSCGASSDIWSLASTIHLIRTSKSLLARLDSRSSLVSWLAWAYGPFPQDAWKAVGEYLSSDSAIPVFTVNTIPQKPPVSSSGHLAKLMGVKVDPYPSEWGENREKVVALMLGDEETPLSIRQRKMLQGEKDRGKYLRIKLPKDSRVWAKFQDQRKRATGCHSLLHEDLSKKRQWYQDTDALNGKTEHRPEISPSMIDDSTLRRLNGKWTLTSNSELDAEGVSGDHAVIDIPNKNGKRALVGDHYGQLNPKKARKFIAEHNLRDQVERVEQNDGMTRFSYCLQPREVDLLASLLRDMLRNDPGERVSIDKVLQHKWFDASRRRLE